MDKYILRDFVLKASSLLMLFAVLLILPSVTMAAEESPALQVFLGEWKGQGKLFGIDAEFTMKWEQVLGRKFVRLTFQNKMKASDGSERVMQAQAFYKPGKSGTFEGTWFDSRGKVLPLEATLELSTLTTLWGTSETELGRTIYSYKETGKIEARILC